MSLLELHCEFTEQENRIIMKHVGLMISNSLTVEQATKNAMKEIDRMVV